MNIDNTNHSLSTDPRETIVKEEKQGSVLLSHKLLLMGLNTILLDDLLLLLLCILKTGHKVDIIALQLPVPLGLLTLLQLHWNGEVLGHGDLPITPLLRPYSEVILVLHAADTLALALAHTAQVGLHITAPYQAYGQVLDRNELVQLLLEIALQNGEFLDGTGVHHGLHQGPDG